MIYLIIFLTIVIYMFSIVVTMYLTQTTAPSKSGERYLCTLLRESYRDGGAVKNRTIANLSHCKPPLEARRSITESH